MAIEVYAAPGQGPSDALLDWLELEEVVADVHDVRDEAPLRRWRAIGFDAALVGEELMRAGADPASVAARTAALVEARPIASFGLGCFGIIAAIAIAILCAITVILLPVTLLLTLATLAAWVFGWAGVYLVAGRRLLAAADRRVQPLLAVVVGGALFALLALVPLVGIPLGLLGGSIALGGALGSRFGTRIEQGDFFAWGHPPAPAAMVSPAPHPPPFEDPPGGNT